MNGAAVGAGSPRALVIGIGNALRGDDGIGVRLVEELAEACGAWSAPGVELRAVQQLTPELALEVVQAGRVLFVDAWRVEVGAREAGLLEPWIEWLVGPGAAGPVPGFSGLGGHAFEPASVAALAQELYGWAGQAALLRVPAYVFGHGEEFSPGLRRVLPRARQQLGEWLGRGLSA